jgi:hypothetical protein
MSRIVNIAATGNLGPYGSTSGGAYIKSIIVNKGVATATFTIYDGQSASAPAVAKGVIDASANRQIIFADEGAWFKNGFFAVLAAANADVSVEIE